MRTDWFGIGSNSLARFRIVSKVFKQSELFKTKLNLPKMFKLFQTELNLTKLFETSF
jgi:hypothetical protein